ncbi:MAG: tRNA-dihydrouridine synthase family protein [Leptospiraceae bacterium]|nr:tRNA-dihydrouridine synthase family protein [Leptospiraceae bacterium]
MSSLLQRLERGGVMSLAPMANFSDSPYRRLCRQAGASFSFSEFISTDAIERRLPQAMALLRYHAEERPIVIQIFGNSLRRLYNAASFIADAGVDGIDINMGCSVRHVAQKGSGAGMLLNPYRTAKIVEYIAARIPVPLSAKIRLGWDSEHLNYMEMAHALEDHGIAFLSVHGRTRAQGYKGSASMEPIAQIKDAVAIPVLANGDIGSYEQARQLMQRYRFNGVLIGRAAIGNPAIFTGPGQLAPQGILTVMERHWQYFVECKPDQAWLLFRKHLARYLQKAQVDRAVQLRALNCSSNAEFEMTIAALQDTV